MPRKKRRRRRPPQPDRFKKARSLVALKSVKVIDRDSKGRVKSVFVNGSQAKVYQVILKRNRKPSTVVAECLLETPAGSVNCPSAPYTICYHVLATVIEAADEKGFDVSFTPDKIKALKLLNLGGNMYRLESEREGGENPLYVVANPRR